MAEEIREPVFVQLQFDINEADQADQGRRAARILTQAFERSLPKGGLGGDAFERAGKSLRDLTAGSSELKALGPLLGRVGDQAEEGFEQAVRQGRLFDNIIDGIQVELRDVVTESGRAGRLLADAFQGASRATVQANAPINDLEQNLQALVQRSQAFRNELSTRGVDPALFASYEAALQDVLRLQTRFRERSADLAHNPQLLKQFELDFKTLNQILRTETQSGSRILETLHGERVVDAQRAGALELAQFRANSQRLIQAEQQRSRARIEIFRFTVRQIQFLERTIVNAFQGAASLAGRGLGAVASAVGRLGGVFRRANTELNEGLRGALIQRETAISRSFSRQTREIRTEVTKQSQVIERFQAQSSRGVVGAVTGRSQLGALFGGGLAIGGGFAFFQSLRDGIRVGGDFVQGLAVLGAQLELTEEQLAGVRAQAIELGNDITLPGVSALDAAQAIQILTKQFAALGEAALPNAQAAARGVLQLARAAGVGAEEAARVVGAAVNIFGADADRAVDIADQVTNALTNAAGVAFNDFSDSFTQAASVFNLFVGPSQEATDSVAEFNAAIAVLARGGLVGSDAGTSLKQFFLQANRGTNDSKEAVAQLLEVVGETGSLFFDAAGKARTFSEALDILRRGTEGLNDAARVNIFQKLFGSDAARAAGILVNLGGNFEDLELRIKEAGSAAAIAAAQNTGLRGALDALKSVIETQQIKTYEKYQGVLAKVLLEFTDLLNAFFEGKGVFRVIRGALLGLAAALGALLVAKAAAEGIQLLTTALLGLSSPLGIIVSSIAIVSAAIGALAAASPEFRAELKNIGSALIDAFGEGAEPIADRLADLVRFIRTKVIPAFVDFSIVAIRQVIPTLRRFADQIARVVTPVIGALREAWNIFVHDDFTGVGPWEEDSPVVDALFDFREIVEDVVGAVREIWSIFVHDDFVGVGPWEEDAPIVDALFDFRETVEAVFRGIRATVLGALDIASPAIEGFKTLLSAIQQLFTGNIDVDLTALPDQAFARRFLPDEISLVEGVKEFGEALAKTVGNIAQIVIRALRPVLAEIVGFIGDFFEANAKSVAGRLGGAAQDFLLGPFQEAASALGRFLGRLVSDPRLLDVVVKLAALAALTATSFITGVLTGIKENLPSFISKLADLIDLAFNSALKQALSNPLDTAKIFAVAFGGLRLFRLFSDVGRQAGTSFLGGISTTLSRTVSTNRNFLLGFFGGQEGVAAQARDVAGRSQRALQSEFARLNRDLQALGQQPVQPRIFGPVTRFGGMFITEQDVAGQRERLKKIEDSLGSVATRGLIVRDQLRRGFAGLGDLFDDIAVQMGGKGRAIGATLGAGIVSGVAAALAGQQLGGATSIGGAAIGLAGVVSSALIPLLTLPPQLGIPLAGITVGIGALSALSAAFKDSGDEAQVAAERVSTYAAILDRFNSVAEASTDITEEVVGQLVAQGADVQALLQRSGFDVGAFVEDVRLGRASITGVISDLAGSLGADQSVIKGFIDTVLRQELNTGEVLTDLDQARRRRSEGSDQALGLVVDLEQQGVDVAAFIDILRTLNTEGGGIKTTLRDNAVEQEILGNATRQTTEATEEATGAITEYHDAFHLENFEATRTQFEATNGALQQQKEDADLVRDAIRRLDEQRTQRINEQIGRTEAALNRARDAAQAAKDLVLGLVGGDIFSTELQAFDQLILAVPEAADRLKELAEGGVSFDQITAKTLEGAQLRQALAPFSQGIRGIVSDAIGRGVIDGVDDEADLAALFAEVDAEIAGFTIPIEITDEATGEVTIQNVALPDEVKQFLRGQVTDFLNDPNLSVALQAIVINDETATKLQEDLDRLQALLKVDVEFSEAQIRRALAEAGLSPSLINIVLDNVDVGELQEPPLTGEDVLNRAERERAISEARLEAKRLADANVIASNLPPTSGNVAIPSINFTVNQEINTLEPEVAGAESVRQARVLAAHDLPALITNRLQAPR